MSDEFNIDLKKYSKLLKKNFGRILLMLIIILGGYYRLYHIDYPVVGYHNWKETHYLTEARNFAKDGFFKHGFFIPEYDYWLGRDGPDGEHHDSFPTISIVVAIVFKIFGYGLLGARLVSVTFSLATIFVMYLFVKKLFKREDFALIAAFLTATSPLLIFFGRQVQLEPIALFFMLLSGFFFLEWKEKPSMKNILLTAVSFTMGFLPRYDHFTIVFPILFLFPYRRFLEKKYWKQFAIAILVLLTIPLWILYNQSIANQLGATIVPEGIQPSIMFESSWWIPIKSYLRDNYTMFGVTLALIGLSFLIIFSVLKKKTTGNKFLLWLVIGMIPWLIISAKYLKGHAYHQYPIAPIFILLEAFAILTISSTIASILKGKLKKYLTSALIIIFLAALLFGFSSIEGQIAAKNRVFDTQFIGLDIAGKYIKENSNPKEKILHSSHQSFGVLWHADRKGTKKPNTIKGFKEKESEGFNWLFIYQWGFSITQNKELWDYVKDNFELKQVAFQNVGQTSKPIYFLMKKGGSFNESQLNLLLQNKPVLSQGYELTRGNQIVNYVNLD